MDKKYGILIICAAILVLCFVGTASAKTWYVDDDGGGNFTGIQDAINSASDGDTILVYSGVYHENVVVNKSVTLTGNGQPVVDANDSGSAITLTADGITLAGFNTTNSGSWWSDAGIMVTSNSNTITGNNASNNNDGIRLSDSSNKNRITSNNVCNNNDDGIDLGYSSNNTITGNTFVNNGLYVMYSYQNTVENNTVNGKPLVYLEDASDYVVGDAGQVILVNCTNISVENLDLSNTSVGVTLWKTEDSKILNNTASYNNDNGIRLDHSSNNTITGNNARSNNWDGIHLDHSSNNTITGNNARSNNWDGIHLDHSSNNTITGNNVCNFRDGINLDFSSNNTITGNNANSNNMYGIELRSSCNNNTITGNNVCNNEFGICLNPTRFFTRTGDVLFSKYFNSSNNIISNNVCSNNYRGIDLSHSDNNNIFNNNCSTNGSYGINLYSSDNNCISDNDCSNNDYGIHLDYSNDNSIINNTCSNNLCGIYLCDSGNSLIKNNNVVNHNRIRPFPPTPGEGIYLSNSSNSKIYLNNFINNTDNVFSNKYHRSANIFWNSTEKITYNYLGTTYESYLGNYWDDYEEKYPDAEEIDATGIWDTPYSIDGDKDNYPLMESFENYLLDFVSHSSTLNVSVTVAIDPVSPRGYSQVTVRVTTTEGMPLSDTSISVSATGGSLSPTSGTTDSKGEFKSKYNAPNVETTQIYTISATASKAGYISGSGSATITVNYEPRRLLTGTFIVKKLSGGRGELTIENGLSSDAIVVLSKSTRPKVALMSVYIQSENTYTITGIPDGVYFLYYSFGEDWDSSSKKFTVTPTHGRFKEELEFETTRTTYKGYTATLHPVPGGTAKTEHVSEADFPE